jgi:hypothetical protein
MGKIILDKNTNDWINDRIENGEPLMFNEFVSFMKRLHEGKIIDKYKTKTYRKLATAKYSKLKKQFKRSRDLY